MGGLLYHAAPRQDGPEIGVESARTVAKCENENCWLSWQVDMETLYCNTMSSK